jgi:hypothetical protein
MGGCDDIVNTIKMIGFGTPIAKAVFVAGLLLRLLWQDVEKKGRARKI